MRVSNKYLAVAYAAVFLGIQSGCGGSGPDAPPPSQDDAESRREGESLSSLEPRWQKAVKDKPTGITATVDISGSSLYLTTSGQTQVDAPAVLVPGASFPNNQLALFLTDAQVGAQTGLLVLEGPQFQLTAGSLGSVDIGSAVANAQAPSGSTTPVVELATEDHATGSKPTVTFPEDWSDTDKSLFFASGATVHVNNITLTGFNRGLLVTATGNTPLTGSVTVTSATAMYWDSKSRIRVATSTVHSPSFALGGEVEAGSLTSADLQPSAKPPSMIKGHGAELTLSPGSVKSQGSFQLTQAVTQEGGVLMPTDVELAYDTAPVMVKTGDRALIPVVFREKGLKGDAVISELQVTGSGQDAVSVPLGQVDSTLETLWDKVGDSGIAAPFLAVALAPLSPFIALGDALSCLFSTCPKAFPIWMGAGSVERFHIIVQGKLNPGTYDATVKLVGRNYAPLEIPVQFTITE